MITRMLIILLLLSLAPHVYAKDEAAWIKEWCGERGLSTDNDDVRFETYAGRPVFADCIGVAIVVEVDFAYKYREGIMQAIEYALLANKIPFLLLIVESPTDCKYVTDAQWLILRARVPLVLSTTGQQCPSIVDKKT